MKNIYYSVFNLLSLSFSLYEKSTDAINQMVTPELSGKNYIYTGAYNKQADLRVHISFTQLAHTSTILVRTIFVLFAMNHFLVTNSCTINAAKPPLCTYWLSINFSAAKIHSAMLTYEYFFVCSTLCFSLAYFFGPYERKLVHSRCD